MHHERLVLFLCVFALFTPWLFTGGKCEGSLVAKTQNENTKDSATQRLQVTNDEKTKEDIAETATAKNSTRSSHVLATQRRLNGGSLPKRDSQLLSLLATRRRQLLADRVNTHLATLSTFASKPDRHNITNAHLELRDSNNTVIKKIIIPDTRGLSVESRSDTRIYPSRPLFRIESSVSKLTTAVPEAKSLELKTVLSPKLLQEAKVVRSELLNNRRKPASEVIRYGPGTRKPLIDLSVVSHETLGIPEYSKTTPDDRDDIDVDIILDPEEEFQVDESNHGVYLFNYTSNDTTPLDSSISISTPIQADNALNISLATSPSLVNQVMKDDNITLNKTDDVISVTTLPVLENKTQKSLIETTTKSTKSEPVLNKDANDNNTLFLTEEIYNHFRPLESELPVEDMAPFLYFGQKITVSAPKENVTQLQFTPTKPTHYIRTADKKRGTYRPTTEKNISIENEDEINENMDVSVVKNVIEKNKLRTTAKIQAPSRHTNLVNAYRKQNQNSTSVPITTPITPNNITIVDEIPMIISTTTSTTTIVPVTSDSTISTSTIEVISVKDVENVTESSVSLIKDDIINMTSTASPIRNTNRTYVNLRRKPIRLTQLDSTTEKEFIYNTTTSSPSTVVYTAVVTSVSITSSVKALNKTEIKNETETDSIVAPSNITQVQNITNVEDLTTVESINAASSRLNPLVSDINNDGRRKNETVLNKLKKKSDLRQRIPTTRPRYRFVPLNRNITDNTNHPVPTPFVLNINRTVSPLLKDFDRSTRLSHISQRYRFPTSTEKSVQNDTSKILNTTSPRPSTIKESSITAKVTKDLSSGNSPQACNNSLCSTRVNESGSVTPKTDGHVTTIINKNLFNTDHVGDSLASLFNNSDKNKNNIFSSTSFSSPTDSPSTTQDVLNNKIDTITQINTNRSLLDEKNMKEVLERRNNEVLIEMEKSNMTIYILAGLGFLPLTIIVMFVIRHIFTKKTKNIDADYEGYFQDIDIKKESQITTVARPPLPPPKKPDQKWEFPRSKLRLQTLLGQGNFGQVWKAEADDLTGHDGLTRLVAVKTIKETATQKEKQELFHEICIMQKIGTHPNVVTLLACCTEQEPYLLIMEYVMCGKLLTYLRDRRSRVDKFQMPRGGLTSRDLTVFAYCVARGMDYLASKGIVHRDLAARNILVDHNKLCKIADFGMSRDITSSDDNGGKPQRNALPVRWMAPEALLYSVYSHETDVWAYGVLLWEIVTLGSTPYATMSGREVLHMVTEGYRLERPPHCKQHLYKTMYACWNSDPAQRPPFSDIRKQLSELLENEPAEGHYVDLDSFYQDSSVYSDPSAIIENDGGISIEYSDELSTVLSKDDLPRGSFHIPNATSLQRNFSSGNTMKNSRFRSETFSGVRPNNHTSVGGFGIVDNGFAGRDGNFSDRNVMDKLSGSSFHGREREKTISRENGHPGNSLISRNSFNGVSSQNNWSSPGSKSFFTKSGSNRSKRISEFECNI